MTAVRAYFIRCDGPNCKDWTRYDVATVTEARKLARTRAGWSSRTDRGQVRDYCPRHRPLPSR